MKAATDQPGMLAGIVAEFLEGNVCDGAHVDADGGEGAVEADAACEPLVECAVTARGLTTSCMPYGDRAFELYFDFLRHRLVLETNDGLVKTLALGPRSVAEFYQEFDGIATIGEH